MTMVTIEAVNTHIDELQREAHHERLASGARRRPAAAGQGRHLAALLDLLHVRRAEGARS